MLYARDKKREQMMEDRRKKIPGYAEHMVRCRPFSLSPNSAMSLSKEIPGMSVFPSAIFSADTKLLLPYKVSLR